MQCWAVSSNHVPAVGERGLGQRLTTAKESSRSDGEKERRECVREKSELESGSVQWYPALQDSASVLSLQLSLYISPLFARIPHHCSDPSSLLFSALFCYNHCFSVVSTDRFLLLLLHLYFFFNSLHPFSEPLIPLSFPPVGWSKRLFQHLHPLFSGPPPCIIPWVSVHLAGKSRMSVYAFVDSSRRDMTHVQVFPVLQKSLMYPGFCRVI